MAEMIAAQNAESESLAIDRATREAEEAYYAERTYCPHGWSGGCHMDSRLGSGGPR